MSKLKKQGAITAISTDKNEGSRKSTRITTIKKVTTSYKVPPLTLRMSLTDKERITALGIKSARPDREKCICSETVSSVGFIPR